MEAIQASFPSDVSYTKPEGGLFSWITLPEGVNGRDLLITAIAKKVAFVPGGAFFPRGGHENTLRLNYSNMPPEKIRRGIHLLSEAMDQYL